MALTDFGIRDITGQRSKTAFLLDLVQRKEFWEGVLDWVVDQLVVWFWLYTPLADGKFIIRLGGLDMGHKRLWHLVPQATLSFFNDTVTQRLRALKLGCMSFGSILPHAHYEHFVGNKDCNWFPYATIVHRISLELGQININCLIFLWFVHPRRSESLSPFITVLVPALWVCNAAKKTTVLAYSPPVSHEEVLQPWYALYWPYSSFSVG